MVQHFRHAIALFAQREAHCSRFDAIPDRAATRILQRMFSEQTIVTLIYFNGDLIQQAPVGRWSALLLFASTDAAEKKVQAR